MIQLVDGCLVEQVSGFWKGQAVFFNVGRAESCVAEAAPTYVPCCGFNVRKSAICSPQGPLCPDVSLLAIHLVPEYGLHEPMHAKRVLLGRAPYEGGAQ